MSQTGSMIVRDSDEESSDVVDQEFGESEVEHDKSGGCRALWSFKLPNTV